MQTKSTKTLTRTLVATGLAASVAASALVGAALAQDKQRPDGRDGRDGRGGGMFSRLDTNNDGAITEDEFLSRSGGIVTRFDANKDGTVSKEEIEAAVAERVRRRVERMMAPFDANEDGSVSQEEFDSYRKKRFALLDRNNDGKVEQKEARVMMRMMGGHRGHHGWRGHYGYHGKGKGGHHRGRWSRDGGTPPAQLDNGRGDAETDADTGN